MLKLIQLGLTLTDADGNLPVIDGRYCLWQFNFREFNLKDDMYARDSIELLKQSGIDFLILNERGIDVNRFGELFMVSGVVLSRDVKWLTFHSGYDFGYLLKLLTCVSLPNNEAEFFKVLETYFPCFYDMKFLMKFTENLHGGLSKLAEHLDKAEKTKAQIKSAMSYPAIVMIVGLGVIWGLMTFVVPQFQEMLADTGQETPWVTQVVIDTSEFFQGTSTTN